MAFLAGVAHDLRNPLNVISLGATYLLKHLPESPEAASWRKQGELIRRSADRAAPLEIITVWPSTLRCGR